ncbi:peptidoglycan-binding protein [Candidatus Uhrbacteria bacterium]|nr:peptidoglycan-binding protein [Candidatus Uhrbacteria bacterium]
MFFICTFANTGHAMSATNVQPANLVQSNQISNTITFTSAVSIPSDGKIKIIFPSGFNVSNASSGSCSSMNGGFLTSVSGQTVTITRNNTGTIRIAGAQTCTIEGIANPSSLGSTGTYTIQIANGSNAVIDQDTVVAADTIIAPGTISVSNVATENQVSGVKSRATITFTSQNTIARDGIVSVIFPTGFDTTNITSPTCTSMDGSFSFSTSSQTVNIIRTGNGINQPAAAESCIIDGIIAPTSTGLSGTYFINTKDNLGNITDSATVTGDMYYAAPSLISTDVQPATLVAGANSVATISFTTVTSTPIDAKIRVTFPSNFNLSPISTVTCATISGSISFSTSSNVLLISRNGNGITEIAGAESCTATNVRNPQISGSTGTYNIEIIDSQSTPVVISSASVSADTIAPNALTGANITPENYVANTTQVHTLNFTSANPIPADGKIIVTYPAGFSLNEAASANCAGFDGSLGVTTSSQSLILTRSGGTPSTPGPVDCLIYSIGNRSPGASGIYSVSTTNATNIVIDQAAAASDTYIASAALTGTNVQPITLVRNVYTDQIILFTTTLNIPTEGKIRITYAAGFDVSAATGGTCTGFDGSLSTSSSGQIVTLSRSGGSTDVSGAKTCRIYGIRNPSGAGSTGTYTISVTDKNNVIISTLATVTADIITVPGTLTSPDIQPLNLVAGATTTATVVFSTAVGIPHDGKIALTFPSDFVLNGASGISCSGFLGGASIATSGTNQLIISRDGTDNGVSAATISCLITSIKNPTVSGSAGSYLIENTDLNGNLISSVIAGADTLTAGNITANLEPDTLLISATTTYTYSFTATNTIPSNGKLSVTFPSSISLVGVTSTSMTCSGLDGSLSSSVSGQTITSVRSGGTTTTENSLITCTIVNLRNPTMIGSAGTYIGRTTNFIDQFIDENTSIAGQTFATSGTLPSADLSLSSLTTNSTPTITLNFNTSLGLPRDGKIVLTFPNGFNLTNTITTSCSGLSGSTTSSVSGQILTITRSGANSRGLGSITCTISGIVNPASAGVAGNYSLELQTPHNLTIEQNMAITGDTFIAPVVSSGGGGGGGGSSTPITTPTFQTSADPQIRKQIEERLAKLPVAQHTLVKLIDDGNPNTQQDSAVYYIGSDGLRHAFPNSKIYFSWYCDFNGVVTLTAKDLASIGLGRNIPYRAGSKLVKFTTDTKVYLVTQFSELRAIPDEKFAAKLFGSNWNKLVDDISDAFYLDYTFGKPFSENENISLESILASSLIPSDDLRITGYTRPAGLNKQICTANKEEPVASNTTNAFKRPSSIPKTFIFKNELSISSASSIEIRYLQTLLIALGKEIYPEARVTGNFGPATEQAIKTLQSNNKIPVTGILNSATRNILNDLLK